MKQLCQWSLMGLMMVGLASCGSAPTAPSNNSEAEAPAVTESPIARVEESPSPSPSADAKPTPQASAAPTAAIASPSAAPVPNQSPVVSAPASPAPASPDPIASPKPPQKIAAANQTEEVTVYRLDNQCEKFVEQKMTVPTTEATNQIVGRVIENSNSPDFKIDNYRIRVNKGTATVDLRLPPDAKRPFAAMSTCEQRSLLGSMQKTLTSNPQLKINSVRFTDGKEELVF